MASRTTSSSELLRVAICGFLNWQPQNHELSRVAALSLPSPTLSSFPPDLFFHLILVKTSFPACSVAYSSHHTYVHMHTCAWTHTSWLAAPRCLSCFLEEDESSTPWGPETSCTQTRRSHSWSLDIASLQAALLVCSFLCHLCFRGNEHKMLLGPCQTGSIMAPPQSLDGLRRIWELLSSSPSCSFHVSYLIHPFPWLPAVEMSL